MGTLRVSLALCIFFLLSALNVNAGESDEIHFIGTPLHLTTSKVDESSLGNQVPRAPMAPVTISIDGNSLYLYGQFSDITMTLTGNEGIGFTDNVSSGAYVTYLPLDLQGCYELQLNDGAYLYTCTLEIE